MTPEEVRGYLEPIRVEIRQELRDGLAALGLSLERHSKQVNEGLRSLLDAEREARQTADANLREIHNLDVGAVRTEIREVGHDVGEIKQATRTASGRAIGALISLGVFVAGAVLVYLIGLS